MQGCAPCVSVDLRPCPRRRNHPIQRVLPCPSAWPSVSKTCGLGGFESLTLAKRIQLDGNTTDRNANTSFLRCSGCI
eukprot:3491640-Rhodomonas_salina.1